MSQQDIDKVQLVGHFEEKKMFNRFQQGRVNATHKRVAIADSVIARYEVNEVRLRALLDNKRVWSIGMETFMQALSACIVDDFTEVKA